MKLKTLLDPNVVNSFQRIIHQQVTPELAKKLAKVVDKVNNETKVYHDTRVSLLKGLADKSKNGDPVIEGNSYKMSAESQKRFNDELETMHDTVVSDLPKLPFRDLQDQIKMSAADYLNLQDFLEEA